MTEIVIKIQIPEKESIIGKKYLSLDNSYAICLSDGKNHSLAGYLGGPNAQITTIVTEPFLGQVMSIFRKIEHYMILVKDSKNRIHSVLFEERSIKN